MWVFNICAYIVEMKSAIALRLLPNRSGRFCVIPKASVSYSILSYYALWFAHEWYYFEQDIDKAKTSFGKATSFLVSGGPDNILLNGPKIST